MFIYLLDDAKEKWPVRWGRRSEDWSSGLLPVGRTESIMYCMCVYLRGADHVISEERSASPMCPGRGESEDGEEWGDVLVKIRLLRLLVATAEKTTNNHTFKMKIRKEHGQ